MSGRVLVVAAGGWAGLGWAGLGGTQRPSRGQASVCLQSVDCSSGPATPRPVLHPAIPTPRHKLVFSDLSLSDFRALGEGLGEGLG